METDTQPPANTPEQSKENITALIEGAVGVAVFLAIVLGLATYFIARSNPKEELEEISSRLDHIEIRVQALESKPVPFPLYPAPLQHQSQKGIFDSPAEQHWSSPRRSTGSQVFSVPDQPSPTHGLDPFGSCAHHELWNASRN